MTRGDAAMLRVQGLTKRFGAVRALDDVSFTVEPSSVVALLGPNGAGKTTTLTCILGVTNFDGVIEVGGWSVKDEGKEVRRRIGYLPQTPALSEHDTCRRALQFLADLKGAGRRRIEPLLKSANLWDLRDTKIGHLSGGMRQRLALAAALLADPPLLLLDEPTASLDVEARREFYELLASQREQGKTVILSTHLFDRLGDVADRIIVLNGGRIVFDGTMPQLVARAPGKRYLVNLNGAASAVFFHALQEAGIGPERVQLAESHWEELLAPLAGDPGGGDTS